LVALSTATTSKPKSLDPPRHQRVPSPILAALASPKIAYTMANNAPGTMRGTPTNRSRGNLPNFNSPSSIPVPRPPFETHASSAVQSEAGGSTMSASRQKQSKRDEVGSYIPLSAAVTDYSGHPEED
jgi:hypothetical protein